MGAGRGRSRPSPEGAAPLRSALGPRLRTPRAPPVGSSPAPVCSSGPRRGPVVQAGGRAWPAGRGGGGGGGRGTGIGAGPGPRRLRCRAPAAAAAAGARDGARGCGGRQHLPAGGPGGRGAAAAADAAAAETRQAMGELTLASWGPEPQPLHPCTPALRLHLRASSSALAAPPVTAPTDPLPERDLWGRGREHYAGGPGWGAEMSGGCRGGFSVLAPPPPTRLLSGAFRGPGGQSLIPSTPPPPAWAGGVPEPRGLSEALCAAPPTNLPRGAGLGVGGLSARLPPSTSPHPGLRRRRRRRRQGPRRCLGAGRVRRPGPGRGEWGKNPNPSW